MRRAILLFVKYPEPGKVKTRLAATVGAAKAVTIYQQLVTEVCSRLPVEGENIVAMYDPPGRMRDTESWLQPLCGDRELLVRQQAFGGLGERLTKAFDEAFQSRFQQVAAIGSDCVEITPEVFAETWQALETHDVVLGPTSDGGYYLVATRRYLPALFTGVAWSTDAVFRQTLEIAKRDGLTVYRLRELDDVDTEDDWLRVQARLNA